MGEWDGDDPASDDIRVMICDDHALFRRGLIMVLEAEDDIEVVGEVGDGLAAVEVALAETPDVMVLDVRMPQLSGIEAASRIKESLPHIKILVLTISDEEDDLYRPSRRARTATSSRRSRSTRSATPCGPSTPASRSSRRRWRRSSSTSSPR